MKLSTVPSKTSLIFSAISAVKSVLESPYNALRPSVRKLSVDNSRPTDAQQSPDSGQIESVHTASWEYTLI